MSSDPDVVDQNRTGAAPDPAKVPGARQFPCKNCAGPLLFKPGTAIIKCPYCGTENDIPLDPGDDGDYLREHDFLAALESGEKIQADSSGLPMAEAVRCGNCNAETTISPDRTSDLCPYCGSPLAMQNHFAFKMNVQAVLPFAIDAEKALRRYRDWVASRWFAPSDFKRRATREEAMRGIYMPYWTYDAATETWYTGQRGDAYYTTEYVQVKRDNQIVAEPRQVRRVQWSHASGQVRVAFDDILIPASHSLPADLANKLEPWALNDLKPFRQEFLSGFVTETYKLSLRDGFDDAKRRMEPAVDQAIRSDIGGDEQRVDSKQTQYDKVTYKHILLPVWLSAYKYGDQSYRFMINAQTGEAAGERPWSVWKIAAAVIAGAALLGALMYFSQ